MIKTRSFRVMIRALSGFAVMYHVTALLTYSEPLLLGSALLLIYWFETALGSLLMSMSCNFNGFLRGTVFGNKSLTPCRISTTECVELVFCRWDSKFKIERPRTALVPFTTCLGLEKLRALGLALP
jgi:hypothetical protein